MSKETHRPDTAQMTFGRYKGLTPEEVAREDPVYLQWLYENASGDKPCSRELYLAAEFAATEEEVGDALDDDSDLADDTDDE